MGKTIYVIIRYILVFIILFVIQRLFNCFVYQTDGISVLFGIFFLAFGISIQWFIKDIFDDIYYRKEMKKRIKELDKMLEDWRKEFTNEVVKKDDSK